MTSFDRTSTGQSPLDVRGDPSLDVRLEKDGRQRRYVIRFAPKANAWYAQVWFSLSLQHRGVIAATVYEAQRQYAQFHREIGELLLDKWTVVKADGYRPTLATHLQTTDNQR